MSIRPLSHLHSSRPLNSDNRSLFLESFPAAIGPNRRNAPKSRNPYPRLGPGWRSPLIDGACFAISLFARRSVCIPSSPDCYSYFIFVYCELRSWWGGFYVVIFLVFYIVSPLGRPIFHLVSPIGSSVAILRAERPVSVGIHFLRSRILRSSETCQFC